MFLVDRVILLAGVLLLVGILSSKVSTRLGLPVLLLFLGVGMLAGEDGIGQIDVDDFRAAHAIGTVVDHGVAAGSALAERAVRDLRRPEGAVITMISREGTMVVPHGSTAVQAGDHLFVIARDDIRPALDRVLGIE